MRLGGRRRRLAPRVVPRAAPRALRSLAPLSANAPPPRRRRAFRRPHRVKRLGCRAGRAPAARARRSRAQVVLERPREGREEGREWLAQLERERRRVLGHACRAGDDGRVVLARQQRRDDGRVGRRQAEEVGEAGNLVRGRLDERLEDDEVDGVRAEELVGLRAEGRGVGACLLLPPLPRAAPA